MAEEPLSITVSGAGNYINATDAAMSTGAFARHGLVAGQPVTYNRAGDYFYQFADPEDYDSVKEFEDEELKKKILDDEEKKKAPPPTAANPHPPELIPDTAEALAVYTSPDVVKVGDKPVPFAVHGKGSDDTNYSPDVRSNGKVIKRHNSKMTTTYGAEPGNAGVKSGTEGQAVEPVSSSPIVRANGIPVQRHSDTCTLNNGNCPGEYVHVKSTEVNKAPDGNDEDDKTASQEDTRSAGEKFGDGFTRNAGETWEGAKQVGSDLWDGTKQLGSDLYHDPLGTLESGANSAGGAISDAATWTSEVAQNMWKDPGSTWARGWDNTTGALGSLWKGISDPYKEAYARGGVAEAVGYGTFDVAKLAVEALATKGALTAAGKTVSVGSGVLRVGDKLEDAGDLAHDAKRLENAVEDGKPGARSTKPPSRRLQFLGKTPSKYSRTGREVRERMRKEGLIRTDPKTGKDMFRADDGKWYQVDSPQTHMGHHPMDAVDYWNTEGYKYGPKSPEGRDWMLDSKNYRFEYGPENSARGGASTSRYRDAL